LGGYNWLDFLNKIMMTVLFLATIVVFVPAFPDPAEFRYFVIPSVPTGSIAIIAGILGWMPTGIDVSIWHSLWTLEKHRDLTSDVTLEKRWNIFRLSLMDMRIGYILSFIVASVFLILAGVFLHGTGDKIDGAEFARSLSKIYTNNIGYWMYFVFMVAAFTAMYSTVYTVMDGFSRAFAEMASTLFPKIRAKWQMKLYWIFVLFTAAFAILILLVLKGKNPVTLVLNVAVLSLCVTPLYYGLNYYCVTRFIKEERFKPKTFTRLFALAGIVVVLLATLVYVAWKFNILG
jgi:Mn2+/Fe2+ NRAMP family transporter